MRCRRTQPLATVTVVPSRCGIIRGLLVFAVAALLLLVAHCPASFAQGGSSAKRPNIVVVMTDDIGYNQFGFNAARTGQPTQFLTPRLDALARKSVTFSNSYVASAVCSPARAALLTGMYTQRFGYEENISRGLNGEVDGLGANQLTMADRLKSLGYATGAIGKWHLGTTAGVNRPLDAGFDEFYGFLGGSRYYYQYGSKPRYEAAIMRNNKSIESTWAQEGNRSMYDATQGRYLTDAFGEEAAAYIDRHSRDDDPFFLYVGFTASHTPIHYRAQDYNRFAHIADPTQRGLAAMTYAMDRAVGTILDKIDQRGIANDTVVLFVNDHGGPLPNNSNAPFRGGKTSLLEGGIRVPMLMHAPGLRAGTYDSPVSTLDLLPTFVSMAAGNPNSLGSDGVNLVPHLTGKTTSSPHESLFWRSPDGQFAVRKGPWKMVKAAGAGESPALYRIASDPSETFNWVAHQPSVAADLVRELTIWESRLAKPKWGKSGIRDKNEFDHFVFTGVNASWGAAGAWRKAGTTIAARLTRHDAYANAVLEFQTSNTSYVATNKMTRSTGQTFMLNEIRFTGNQGSSAHLATINGNPLLLVSNLANKLPRLQNDATGVAGKFTFRLDNDLELLNNLEISGNGTQYLALRGSIRDFSEPRGIIKNGTSEVVLQGSNTFGGKIQVQAGILKINGPNAAIRNSAGITISKKGVFEQVSGLVTVPEIDNSSGGMLIVRGGRMQVNHVKGHLNLNGGTFDPSSFATITGNYTQAGGTLQLDLGVQRATNASALLSIAGSAMVAGNLEISFAPGFTPTYGDKFTLIDADGGLTGKFAKISIPSLASHLQWNSVRLTDSIRLAVGLRGDYNQDGRIDVVDYVVWRQSLGHRIDPGGGGDGDFDGVVSKKDYALWSVAYSTKIAGVPSALLSGHGALAVPEPCLGASAAGLLMWLAGFRRARVES